MNNKTTPYVSLGMGYSLNATRNFEGTGFLLDPTVGISFKVSEKSTMNVGLGYEVQMIEFYSLGSTSRENSGAISVNVGISF